MKFSEPKEISLFDVSKFDGKWTSVQKGVWIQGMM